MLYYQLSHVGHQSKATLGFVKLLLLKLNKGPLVQLPVSNEVANAMSRVSLRLN